MLVNSTTQLNKLKFKTTTGDRRGGGRSGQPYIVKRIPGVEQNNPNQTFEEIESSPSALAFSGDFLLRGGTLALEGAIDDVSRLTQMFFDTKSLNGFEFIAKQNVLSRNNVKTEASFGGGYAGGGLNQGVYTPVGTLAQALVDPVATGITNLFGLNPFTDDNPLNNDFGNDSSFGINSYFGTVNQQNISNTADEENRLVLLQKAVTLSKEQTTKGGNITLLADVTSKVQTKILSYGGGPGSILGIGNTNIYFADQRTGFMNAKLPVGVPSDGKKTNTGGFKNATGPNNYSVFGKAPSGDAASIEQSITGIVAADENVKTKIRKSNLFHVGATTAYLDSNLDDREKKDVRSELQDGYAINLEKIEKYSDQPEGGLRTFNTSVYKSDDPKTTKTNEHLKTDLDKIKVNNTQVLTHQELSKKELNSSGEGTNRSNPSDFRKELIDTRGDGGGKLTTSRVLSISPDYQKQNQNVVYNQGDPGQTAGQIIGAAGQQTKNVLKYGVDAKTLVALDKLNALPIYTASQVNTDLSTKDSVNFNIAIMKNGTNTQRNYIHFRAFIEEFNDNYTAKWDPVQYVGRGEELYNYQGFGREISMAWTVYAQSKAELIPMYKKLNYLASSLAPDYSSGGYMRGNIVRLTMGGYLYDQPGIITGLSYGIPEESPWEIAINENGEEDTSVKQMPHMIQVTGFQFIPIQKFVPAKADDLVNPTQKYIALANSAGSTNYSDVYKSYENTGAPVA